MPAALSGAAGYKLDPAVWEQGRDWVMEPAVKAARGSAASNRGGAGHPPHVGFRLISKKSKRKKKKICGERQD